MRVQSYGFGDLAPHRQDRIERGHGLLKDHPERSASPQPHRMLGQREQIDPVEEHLPPDDLPGRRDEAEEAERGHALAAARLPDQAEHLTTLEPERHAVDRARFSGGGDERHREVTDLEQRHQRVVSAAASSGSTRSAPGGPKSPRASGTLGSTESYASVALDVVAGTSTSSRCGKPCSYSPNFTRSVRCSSCTSSTSCSSSVSPEKRSSCAPSASGRVSW